MFNIKKENKYKWEFDNVGGSSRVRLSKGEDIRHLGELDPKKTTVQELGLYMAGAKRQSTGEETK